METRSLCPVCLKVISAEIVEKGGKVLLRKECPEHGFFEDEYWSDAGLYKRFASFGYEGRGPDNPITKTQNGCPLDCGLCANHKSATVLANIDLTNRCNMRCPICFANATSTGYVYEPSFEQVKNMMIMLREQKPARVRAIQFAGGEPTVREDLLDIVRLAREMGFGHVQLATNGIRLAESVEYCRELVEAGLHTVYLQFDGITPKPYVVLRGYDALPQKLKAIENCRKANLTSIVLVPTLAKGVNDGQIGDMIRFAARNSDVIRGINAQPISFCGRVEGENIKSTRVTIPDFFKLVEQETGGQILAEDFYPIPIVVPLSLSVQSWSHIPQTHFTCHPHCGAATYVFVDGERLVPLTRFIDVEAAYRLLLEVANKLERDHRFGKAGAILEITKKLPSLVHAEKLPRNVDAVKLILNLLTRGTPEDLAEFHRKAILIGCMHFMDAYNFDLSRVEKCVIHYAIPDGRIIPFCSFNVLHRTKVEEEFSTPIAVWTKANSKSV